MKICKKTVMDRSDPDIIFDENGISNHWHSHFKKLKKIHTDKEFRDKSLNELVKKIKSNGKHKKYDCVIGLSGGIDSAYLCLLVNELGLKPLIVHFDNGWNSELAVKNIENIISKFDLDLYTYVVDWKEFRDLQLSFLKASTPDGEIPTDHGIIALLYEIANKFNVKYILTGVNLSSESILPLKWGYGYFDLKYIKDVQKKFGSKKFKTFPTLSLFKLFYYSKIKGIKSIPFLDYFDYNKEIAKRKLIEEINWKDYGGKHLESNYTKFFQTYILYKKFNIDKRKAHLSNLICSNQITREEALKILDELPYDEKQINNEIKYVLNKFEISTDEFNEIMEKETKTFFDYRNNYFLFERLKSFNRFFQKKLNLKILKLN